MKILQRATRKALILSPAASHPQDFGNRRRVYQTCDFLRMQGYEIHFLLYPMEPDWMARVQEAARDMRREWDSFQIIPSSRPLPLQSPAVGQHHEIDEWWDPTIGDHLSWLFAREHFDVFVVNYVFMSKAFEYPGSRTVRVLETHDRFAGRKELLTALGARIESFYTTEAEEKLALDRSDLVIAIKESEAEFYRGLTQRDVISVPFWLDQELNFPQPRGSQSLGPLRAGFIGALNVVNVANMTAFLREFESGPESTNAALTLDVAGGVCHQLESAHPQVRLLGQVSSLRAFYDSLDVVIVPMTLSTGLKIKTGEALAFGKAVVSMPDGFDGFPPIDEFHCLGSFAAVCRALTVLARDRDRLAELERRSHIAALLARRRTQVGYRRMATAISRFQPAILFLTDQPVFEESNVGVERLAQWCQLCSGVATTVVGYVGNASAAMPRPELATVEIVVMGEANGSLNSAFAAWHELERRYAISETVISADGTAGVMLWNSATARCQNVTLDTWCHALADVATQLSSAPAPDYWATFESGEAAILRSRAALRYQPRFLDAWAPGQPFGALIILCGPDSADRSGLEVLMAGRPGPDPDCVVTLAAAPGAAFEAGFFGQLCQRPRPGLILAIGSDARALALCDALATIFDVSCLQISNAQFPVLVVDRDGAPCLCASYAELAGIAGNLAILARSACSQRNDTGWSAYKSQLVQRLARSRNR